MLRSGRFEALKHTQRTHMINLAWLHDCHMTGLFEVEGVNNERMAAYIFTKFFTSKSAWSHACGLIGVWEISKVRRLWLPPGGDEDQSKDQKAKL